MKTCNKCSIEKDLDSFYTHPCSKDGHLNECKACTVLRVRRNRERNLEEARRKETERRLNRIYTREEKDAINARRREWRSRDKRVTFAHNVVNRELIDQKPLICSICGVFDVRIIGHHPDYDKPYEVVWCCDMCHTEIHRGV